MYPVWIIMKRTKVPREKRFNKYLDKLAYEIGHADRHKPLKAYIKGLCLPGERKSIEPMAARIDPFNVQALHQSMHHLVSNAPWDDDEILHCARNEVLGEMDRHGGVMAWIVDDTGIPKKGKHSVGVARQYCGNLGKQENCQVTVSLSIANEAVSIPVAHRLYLPELWAEDIERRKKAGVPEEIPFRTKWQISLAQIASLYNKGVHVAPVIADAGYGNITDYRDILREWEIPYVVGIQTTTTVWEPGKQPSPPLKYSGRGRPPKNLRRSKDNQPKSVEDIALQLPPSAWIPLSWREGTKGKMISRFAFLRVRSAHNDSNMSSPRSEEWLIIEWPENASRPTKYWLSSLPEETEYDVLITLAKIRWRIERDYEELKGEFGMDHYEGRGWMGFHHHVTLCIAAYAFMAAERARFSPPETFAFIEIPALPAGFRPRGSPNTA